MQQYTWVRVRAPAAGLGGVFHFDGLPIRVIDRHGEPWFVAGEICEVLGIGNTCDAVSRLGNDGKGIATIYTPRGKQRVGIINEYGLYSIILSSRKPEAKRLKMWVTCECLLPQHVQYMIC